MSMPPPNPDQGGYPPAGPPPGPPPGPPAGYGAPPAGPPSYALPSSTAPRAQNRRGLVIFGVLVIVLVVIVGGVFLFRDRISGNVTELQVGDCFDKPAITTDSITDIQHQPCTDPHDAEVVYVVADTSASYPGVAHFDTVANSVCTDQNSLYIATDFNARDDIGGGYFYPTSDSWDSGNKNVTCYIDRTDDQKLVGSLKGIGTGPLPTPR